ncbi:hypothetical protein AXF42_Ash010148 [Apostasia shenzhenica]|uniref:GIR1-like zinc ribbon domain-containing protein n=1 Tax=Apostasia shenzhenica TaxID=1088818 RepID=A0A2I0A9N4_9ASPA|nr:hypothetical protein AXF42_Ash010148 [Apostasia shenzhenica]
MAAEVSSMVREVSGYKEEGEGKRDLVTRDLLGGGKVIAGGEVDIEPAVSLGWDRRIDLLPAKAQSLSIGSDPVFRELHDLNLPPPSSSSGVISEESSRLDLTLSAAEAAGPSAPFAAYRSVCTLEKVKSALDRAERELRWSYRRRADCGGSTSPSSSTTSSSLKRRATESGDSTDVQADSPFPHHPVAAAASGGMVAAGCPVCLLYVLISTADPRCPRCDSHVPVPALKKKTRIDLNSSSSFNYY